MRKLYLSLLSSALFSLVVLGWLIDSFSQNSLDVEDKFAWESKIVAGITSHLESVNIEDRNALTAKFAQNFKLDIKMKEASSLALPTELTKQMLEYEGLILEDGDGFYLLKSSASLLPHYLEIRLAKTPDKIERVDIVLTLLFYSGVCIFMWFILAPLAKRLSLLTQAAKRFAAGDVTARIEVNHFTYIRDVELAFNRMANQIEKLLAENKLMASSLSHDIRTPVACLRFGVEAAIESDDIAEAKHYLARMEADLVQMESMLKSYLSFATLEQKAQALNFETTNIEIYLSNIAEQLKLKVADRNLRLTVSVTNDFIITADLHWLARAISNLLNNACDFAKHHIYLHAQSQDNQAFIFIEDDGPGIAKENWQHVFTPFYKEQSHRNRAGQSYGLGLAIVAKVADWHHGQVTVTKSEKFGGARFCFSFPLTPVAKIQQ
ncbi:Signal transduction histidine kinase [Pseudoalteromonas luteoviolacea B = ATCC 29581]|nr:Signal transduction histidine kinase [Pseudoalteromonas luteoviolacea B = ATCC 29581]